MNVVRARCISLGLLVLAIVFFLIAMNRSDTVTIVMCIAGLAVFLASCVVQLVFHRCPHCGRFLDRNFWGGHCQYCGNLLTEESKR